jgi:PUA domain protein
MRKLLRKKEIRELKEHLKEDIINNAKRIEELKDNDGHFIFIDEEPVLFELNNRWINTLHSILKNSNSKDLKKIKVDQGAIKFVVNGADVMRPGIVEVDETIAKDEIILIIEETHNKPLALGSSLLSGTEINAATSGKVIKNIHYVGDIIWNKKI